MSWERFELGFNSYCDWLGRRQVSDAKYSIIFRRRRILLSRSRLDKYSTAWVSSWIWYANQKPRVARPQCGTVAKKSQGTVTYEVRYYFNRDVIYYRIIFGILHCVYSYCQTIMWHFHHYNHVSYFHKDKTLIFHSKDILLRQQFPILFSRIKNRFIFSENSN